MNYYVNKKEDSNSDYIEIEDYQKLKNMLTQSFMIVVMNLNEEIIEVNEKFTRALKYTSSELYLKDYWILNSGYHSEDFKKSVKISLQNGEQWSGEICQRTKNEELIWLKSTMIPLLDDCQDLQGYLVVSTDITEKKAMEKWRYMACHHELTSLPNRRMLSMSLDSYVSRMTHTSEKLAILFLDINKFKMINDRYGHIVGDQFLIELGNRLSTLPLLRNSVFHISGDEFVILIEGIVNLEEQVQSILKVFSTQFMIENHQFYASASIGASVFPDHSTDIQTVIKYANAAMFTAKRDELKMFAMHQ